MEEPLASAPAEHLAGTPAGVRRAAVDIENVPAGRYLVVVVAGGVRYPVDTVHITKA
jgi:hypothetical protein